MLKIAITGSNGLIGSQTIDLLNNTFSFIPILHKQVDITDNNQVWNYLQKINFDILLHLAAYTNVDKAEQEKKTAWEINVQGTKNLFQAVKQLKKKFIYISTDFVFDGKNPPFYENSKPNPISWYGKIKYEGEKLVKNKAMIIRTSYPFGVSSAKKNDFVRQIISLLKNNTPLNMVKDSLITPTHIDDFVFGLKYLIKNFRPDIFHLVGNNSLSPFEAGILIAKLFNLNPSLIKAISYQSYFKDRAQRPQYSVIKSKENDFYQMKNFHQSLKQLMEQELNKN